jgi:hypothetical protein
VSSEREKMLEFNCVVLDVCRVRIGDYSLFGPAVQIAGNPCRVVREIDE